MKLIKSSLVFILYFLIVSYSNPPGSNYSNGRPLISKPVGEREVLIKFIYKVVVHGHLNSMRLKMIIPDDIKNRQTINSMTFSIEPDSFYKANSNSYALFKFYDVDKSFKIIINTSITIFRTIEEKNDPAAIDMSKYLVAEKDIEADSPAILAVAATLKQKTDIETVIKTFDYVKDKISYERNPAIGAEKVLETGVGKCMDFSDLFVALLRANKIPAKSMFGMVVNNYVGGNPLHAWPEAYLKKQGWVRFDPTTGHSDITQEGKNYVMRISNKYVTLSEGRNDPELHVYQYHYSYSCNQGSEVRVKCDYDIAAQ